MNTKTESLTEGLGTFSAIGCTYSCFSRKKTFSPTHFPQLAARTRVCCLLCRGKGQACIVKSIVSGLQNAFTSKGIFYTSQAYFTDIKAYKENSFLGAETQGQYCFYCFPKARYFSLFPLVHSLSLLRHVPRCQ